MIAGAGVKLANARWLTMDQSSYPGLKAYPCSFDLAKAKVTTPRVFCRVIDLAHFFHLAETYLAIPKQKEMRAEKSLPSIGPTQDRFLAPFEAAQESKPGK